MKIIKQVPMLILIAIFLISCRTSTNKENPTNNLEKNIENIKDLNIKYDITNNNFIGIVYYK